MIDKKTLIIIVPCYNEQETISIILISGQWYL